MGLVPEAKLVVKHTFLEFEHKSSSDHSVNRERSQTEPFISSSVGYGEVPSDHRLQELLQGASDSSSSSSHPGDTNAEDLETYQSRPHAASAVLFTPEATPLLYPMARHIPGWLQDEWAEGALPEAFCTQQQHVMAGYGQQWNDQQWNEQQWWPPASYAMMAADPNGGMSCEQFQAEYPAGEQVMWSMAVNADSNDGSYGVAQDATLTSVPAPGTIDGKERRTTVMLRDLPEAYSRSLLLKLLDAQGFFGRFDFVYLPVDFKHQRNLGYALINLVSPSEALRLTSHFQDFATWGLASDKICSVGWCSPQQGLEAHVERYRNSPVMHESVPEEWRPMLLSHGVPIQFPPPTLKIKAPKVKGRQA